MKLTLERGLERVFLARTFTRAVLEELFFSVEANLFPAINSLLTEVSIFLPFLRYFRKILTAPRTQTRVSNVYTRLNSNRSVTLCEVGRKKSEKEGQTRKYSIMALKGNYNLDFSQQSFQLCGPLSSP